MTNLKSKTTQSNSISIKDNKLIFINKDSNNEESLELKDIKRVEVTNKVGLIVDSWGEEVEKDDKNSLLIETINTLHKSECEVLVFIYMENNQVKSKRLSFSNLNLINIEEDGVFIDDLFIYTSSLFYIVPLINEKIKGSLFTINDYKELCVEGQTVFNNPNCFINQFL